MRLAHQLMTIAVLTVTSATVSIPALALDSRGAVALCDRNPKCSVGVLDEGTVRMCVKQPEGSDICVDCPGPGKPGECVVVGRQVVGGSKKPTVSLTVDGVLAQ